MKVIVTEDQQVRGGVLLLDVEVFFNNTNRYFASINTSSKNIL